ncbi:hypothetical protein CAEBREN_11502 [Caenorhabditis brenneri]|uniref:C-type lectin domain-containing protein n=1 Tax=Caenorhabditis brenneri TaxID=135651 RepID=G0NPC4_CAEBE|nr:hypothetical protein CAEBREN_11502 [Caenorhabditis brenneri]
MIKFYGEITTTNKFSLQAPNGVQFCYKTGICVAVSECPPTARWVVHTLQEEGGLKLSLSEAASGVNNIVAIKTVLPDRDCPNNYTDVDFKFPSPDGDIHSWKKVNGLWKFESCKKGWKRFGRSNKIVCIKPLKLNAGVLKEQAASECVALNAVLVGVETVAESVWMSEQVLNLTYSTTDHAFWLPGMRSNPCSQSDSIVYKSNFNWDDGLTDTRAAFTTENSDVSCLGSEGEDERCWAIMNKKDGRTATLFDVACGGSAVMQGAFCGYKLYK